MINQYYDPDIGASGQILTSLCESLASQGIELTVVCGQPSYTEDAVKAPSYEERSNKRQSLGRHGRHQVEVFDEWCEIFL